MPLKGGARPAAQLPGRWWGPWGALDDVILDALATAAQGPFITYSQAPRPWRSESPSLAYSFPFPLESQDREGCPCSWNQRTAGAEATSPATGHHHSSCLSPPANHAPLGSDCDTPGQARYWPPANHGVASGSEAIAQPRAQALPAPSALVSCACLRAFTGAVLSCPGLECVLSLSVSAAQDACPTPGPSVHPCAQHRRH